MALAVSEAIFACRIVVCDHYTAPPIQNLDPTSSLFRGSPVKYVPIIRIFGSTPTGQKCCLHVHGFFPYVYVPSPISNLSSEFLHQLASTIDAALNSSLESIQKEGVKFKKEERQHVYEITPIYAIPFYGYHNQEVLFLKISFYSPLILRRAGEILQSGTIMNTVFQPHELHVSYEMKFLIDFDLYGMDNIALKDVKFRVSGASEENSSRYSSKGESPNIWNMSQLKECHRLPVDIKRMAACELEADCLASDIIRTNGNNSAGLQNPGLRFIWKDEILRRRLMNIDQAPTVPVSQDRAEMVMLTNEIQQFETLENILREILNESNAEESFRRNQSRLDMFDDSFMTDVSDRNLSLASNQSMISAFGDLLNHTVGQNMVEEAMEDDRFSDHSQMKSEDEDENDDESAGREAIELSQRVEEFSDSDDDGDHRLQQVDGPPGNGEIDSSSDDGSDEDSRNNGHYSGASQKNCQRHVRKDVIPPEIKKLGRSSYSAFGYILDDLNDEDKSKECDNKPLEPPKARQFLTLGLKPPSRNQVIQQLADAAAKGISNRREDDRRRNDIDAIDIEEIQARLSPDEESFIRDVSNMMDQSHDQVAPAKDTPEVSVLFQNAKGQRRKVRGRRLVFSQPVEQRTKHSEVLFASARDGQGGHTATPTEQLDRSGSILHNKRQRLKRFALRRIVRGTLLRSTRTPKKVRSISKAKKVKQNVSELEAPSNVDSFGFNSSALDLVGAKVSAGAPCLTVMSLEVHANTRGDLRPDPEFDSIGALFYAIYIDNPSYKRLLKGAIVVCSGEEEMRQTLLLRAFDKFNCATVDSEISLFNALVAIIKRYDPDILVGYEIQLLSWGFIFERAKFLGVNLHSNVSRIPEYTRQSHFSGRDDYFSMADVRVAGRIVLNFSRILRHETVLYFYTFENVVYNLLRKRIPSVDFRTLTQWFSCQKTRWRVLDYYLFRVMAELEMMNHCDLLNRASEMARLCGIQFFEALTRGSQFRVESMLLRMCKTRNYIALSPSVRQRSHMAAPECIPLAMEPESRFYTDPVLVLDFQSLYPSMAIAYNYCYSTCLGRIRNYPNGDVIEFGCYKLAVRPDLVKSLLDSITISPAGVAFVKADVRRGIIPQMLDEILNTRVMVKQSAKLYKNDKSVQKILDARQYGLKMLANLTYGYTAATFSGRMPCTEISDSIVSKGRETLLRAIDLVNNEKKWDARVVYGDTDSLFVLLAGRTKEEAFRIGQEIVDAVSIQNPKPVKLKFEKVYYPCVLQTKKRYVGYAYETLDQKEPVFDAKGIETVRRDVCPAVAKILQKSLETLFITKDVSTVRQYVIRQFQRIHQGRASPLDFIFTRRYRGRENYKPDAVAPVLLIARRRLQKDRRAEPRIKERVPYLIVSGHPGSTLISCVREPSEFMSQRGLRLNYRYYITKQICAALNRVFCLLNVDTLEWYQSMPRSDRCLYGFGMRGQVANIHTDVVMVPTISQYFQVRECAVCRNVTTREAFCVECGADPQRSAVELFDRIRCLERRRDLVYQLCNVCMIWGSSTGNQNWNRTIECTSIVCPITYKRSELDYDLFHASQLRKVLRDP